MGEANEPRCELKFDKNRFLEEKVLKHNPPAVSLRKRLEDDGVRIDVRAVEGFRVTEENIFTYNDDGTVSLNSKYSHSKVLYCNGHMPDAWKEDTKLRSFKLDEEGCVINMHGARVCTGCKYF